MTARLGEAAAEEVAGAWWGPGCAASAASPLLFLPLRSGHAPGHGTAVQCSRTAAELEQIPCAKALRAARAEWHNGQHGAGMRTGPVIAREIRKHHFR